MSDAKQKRSAQVPSQLGRLDNEVGELEKIVDMLRNKLQPILRNESSNAVASQKDEESLVDIADGIRAGTSRISDVVEIVGNIIELLEL